MSAFREHPGVHALLAEMNTARGELEAVVAGVPPVELVELRKDNWTAKDHLFHLATWDLYLSAVLAGEPRLAALGVLADPQTASDFDALNQHFFELGQFLPLNQVLGMFRGNRARIIDQVQRLSDADLERSLADYQPSSPPPPVGSLRYWIVAITIEHDRKHHGWMRTLMNQAKGELISASL